MAFITLNGTNDGESVIDENRPSPGYPFFLPESNLVTINGLGGDDILLGRDLFSFYLITPSSPIFLEVRRKTTQE